MSKHRTPSEPQAIFGRRLVVVLLAAVGGLALSGVALAFWSVLVTAGPQGSAKAAQLSAVTSPVATVNGSGAITISWTLPGSQLSGATYTVTRTSPSSSTVCTVASNVTSCQDTGLTANTLYSYSIQANLSSWQSSAATVSATTSTPTFVISLSAGPYAAGTQITIVTITAKVGGVTDTTYSGSKTIDWSGLSISPAPSNTPPVYPSTGVTFASGVASPGTTFTTYFAGSNTFTATDHNATSVTGSISFSVSDAGAATFLVPTPGSQTAGVQFTEVLTARDSFSNTAVSYAGLKSIVWSGPGTAPSGATPTYQNSLTFTNGVSAAATITLFRAESTVLSAAQAAVSGTAAPFTVGAGAANHFAVTAPASATAGVAFSTATLAAHDLWDNVATGYAAGNHTITWSGSATSPAPSSTAPSYPATTVSFTNGVATTTLTATLFSVAGPNVLTATATSPALTGSSASITVGAGAANHFAVTAPASATAGVAFSTATLAAHDLWDNVATGYAAGNHTITWSGSATSPAPSSTAPSYPATTVSFTNGVATTTLTATLFSVAGPNVLTASATAPTLTGSSASITVGAGAANHFAVTAPASATAGVAFSTATLAAHDLWDNVATGYAAGNHTITWSGSATSPAPSSTAPSYPATTVSFTNGVATTTLTATLFSVAGPNVLTASATAPTLTGSSASITVGAGAADHFAVTAPASATAGVAFSTATLAAHDLWDNVATGYAAGNHTITWSGSATSAYGNAPSYPATTVSFTNGVATTTLTATLFSVAGPNVLTASATAPTLTGSSATISVSASATRGGLVFTSSSATCANGATINVGNGTAWTSKVSVADLYGNPVTNNTGGTVTVTVTQTGSGTLTVPSPYNIANGSTETPGSFSDSRPNGNNTSTVTATPTGTGTSGWVAPTCSVSK